LAETDSFVQNESGSAKTKISEKPVKMSHNNEWTTVTPRRYVAPHARPAAAPPAPRRPNRDEEFPALPGAKKTKVQPVKLESTFNRLAVEMQEERDRQELADAEASRQRRRAVYIPFPWDMRSGQSRRFQRCDGVVVIPTPMEYRDEDWDPVGSSNPSSDDEREQNTEIADGHDRH
jgi:hypothetical protein